MELPNQLRRRVAIDRVSPEVNGGRFAVKRVRGDEVVVEADIVCDGHDELDCRLHIRHGDTGQWTVLPMECVGNDLWRASFIADRIGLWHYFLTARSDSFATWLRDLGRREAAGDALQVDLVAGSQIVAAAAHAAPAAVATEIERLALQIQTPAWRDVVHSDRLRELISLYGDRRDETQLDPPRAIWADRARARLSSWYEVFPRSWSRVPGKHGTLADLVERLDYVRWLGFDVLYLAPIHPIGKAFRKGRNNSLEAGSDDVGSPWGIGGPEGGHTALHSQLGTFDDFERLRTSAEAIGIELALDLAVQCSPDHPWVLEHPEWFRQRADGTIQYAENPPKKYQDIVPFDFQCEQWRQLWEALLGVVRFWVEKGVRIFRVDNPHTKPFAFWEWLITDIHCTHPDVLFLAEAFTRPKAMYRLAKLGFSQSYTYFTWRTEKQEIADYFSEVSTPPVAEFFRPNFWPNTPDILHESLQQGGRPMFLVRLALAALSVGNWGIYGPAMELLEAAAIKPGSEEYLNSEKYEIRQWNLEAPESLAPFIRRINEIRREEPSLARVRPPLMQQIDDPQLLAWCRYDRLSGNCVLVVVNLQPGTPRTGRLTLDSHSLDLQGIESLAAHDLLDGGEHAWPINGITIECSLAEPVRVFRIAPLPAQPPQAHSA
ncbi:MAG: maltotransferase domain-containing protein [Planctomycetota bacterium]